MTTSSTLVLALAAGFLGGLASHGLLSTPVYAQTPTSGLQVIRANEFVLVDSTGVARGVFGIEKNGTPMLEVADSNGHVFTPGRMESWGTKASFFRYLHYPNKPTLLPIKP